MPQLLGSLNFMRLRSPSNRDYPAKIAKLHVFNETCAAAAKESATVLAILDASATFDTVKLRCHVICCRSAFWFSRHHVCLASQINLPEAVSEAEQSQVTQFLVTLMYHNIRFQNRPCS